MHKPYNYEIRYKLIFLWLLINFCIAVVIASIVSIGVTESFSDLFIVILLTTYIISLLSVVSGYACGYFFYDYPLHVLIPINLVVTLTASYCGIRLALLAGCALKSMLCFVWLHACTKRIFANALKYK